MSGGGAERRATIQLLAHWIETRGDAGFPPLSELEAKLSESLLEKSFIIRVENPPMYSDFSFFGQQLVDIFGTDVSALQVGEALDNLLLNNTIDFYHTSISRRAPVSEASRFLIGGKEARYRSLIVPVSEDGKVIDHLIGTSNFRIFD